MASVPYRSTAMPTCCAFGLHRWSTRPASVRPGTMVSRCKACGKVRVRHKRRSGAVKHGG